MVAEPGPVSAIAASEDSWRPIQDEIMALSSSIAAAQARILDLLISHEDELTGGDDPVNWFAWVAGMKPSTAKRHLRLAQRLSELPLIKECFGAGGLSFDKTETIATVASTETEQALLTWAQHGTCSQLGSVTSGLRRAKVNSQGAAAAQRDRYLDYHYTDEGSLRLRAQMPAEQGALVARAIEAAEQALWEEEKSFSDHELTETQTTDQNWARAETSGARRADALVSLAETFLGHGLSTAPVSDRYQVMIHVDQASLRGDPNATCELPDGTGLSTDTARRIACDCSILALLEGDGIPLKLGRTRRTISPSLRKALEARDRHCLFPGCANFRRLAGHHVKHWIGDGLTEPDNITLLCPRHHRLVHEGRYTMTFDGKSATFFRPDGAELPRVATYRSVSQAELAEWQAASGTDLDTWAHTIDPFSLADAVSWLCDKDPDLGCDERAVVASRAGPDTG